MTAVASLSPSETDECRDPSRIRRPVRTLANFLGHFRQRAGRAFAAAVQETFRDGRRVDGHLGDHASVSLRPNGVPDGEQRRAP